jgi:hypothetical protein
MGKKPAEIEHEIAEKRAAISTRIEQVESRIASELGSLKRTVVQPSEGGAGTPAGPVRGITYS